MPAYNKSLDILAKYLDALAGDAGPEHGHRDRQAQGTSSRRPGTHAS